MPEKRHSRANEMPTLCGLVLWFLQQFVTVHVFIDGLVSVLCTQGAWMHIWSANMHAYYFVSLNAYLHWFNIAYLKKHILRLPWQLIQFCKYVTHPFKDIFSANMHSKYKIIGMHIYTSNMHSCSLCCQKCRSFFQSLWMPGFYSRLDASVRRLFVSAAGPAPMAYSLASVSMIVGNFEL